MKKLVALILVVLSFTVVKAQDAQFSYYDDVPFLVSNIKIIAPDNDDAVFLQAAIREELIRVGKICLAGKNGDTIVVNLVVQHNDQDKSNGRDGKWGEILLAIISNNGLVGATARGYMECWDHGSYYKKLQDLTKELAKKFQFQ